MENNVRFDINPHVIKQLGEELVSDEITALMELVKNSYDADASFVSVEINTEGRYEGENLQYGQHKGFIVIEDDGFGMDEATILKSWLTISYSMKRAKDGIKPKTPKGRTPLGDKGLGRLSTQRLANICEIFTMQEKASHQIHIAFNWKDFEKYDALGKVPVTLKRLSPAQRGTKLVLTDLTNNEIWKGDRFERFKGLISQMISPYTRNRPFNVYIRVNGQDCDLIKENENLRDVAVAKYEFEFDRTKLTIKGKIKPQKLLGNKKDDYYTFIAPDQGKKFCDFFFSKNPDYIVQRGEEKYLLEFRWEFNLYFDISGLAMINREKANPGKFFGEINEFSYDSALSQDEQLKSIFNKFAKYKDFAQSQAGIKLYRNGFAVKPFGLDGQDWLRLGEGQTTANSYYGMRPSNVIGYVAIDESENIHLKEKTDREGLLLNPYSDNFMMMMFFIRDKCNLFVEKVRRSYLVFLSVYKIQNNKIQTVQQAFKELNIASKEAANLKEEFHKTKNELESARQKSNNYVKIVQDSPLFTSEQEREAAKILQEINVQLEKAEILLTKLVPLVGRSEKLSEINDLLEPKITLLQGQLENFSELASLGLTAETVSHEFSSIAERLSEQASAYSSKLSKDKLTDHDVHVLMEYIRSTVNGLKVQLKHLDPSLKYNRERKEKISLKDFFQKDEAEYYDERFQKNGIRLILEVRNNFNIEINKGKIIQVFDNLFNNSEYWLQEKQNNETDFSPEIKIVIEKPWVYFSDNGYGIPPVIKASVFEPFVTTKPKGKGRGLGLFIIQQLLDSERCMITLEPQFNGLGRHYIFSLNFSNIIV